MIKNILYVEDGSIDVDELLEELDETTKVIIYRQGSKPPMLVQPAQPINCYEESVLIELKRKLGKISIMAKEAIDDAPKFINRDYEYLYVILNDIISEADNDA